MHQYSGKDSVSGTLVTETLLMLIVVRAIWCFSAGRVLLRSVTTASKPPTRSLLYLDYSGNIGISGIWIIPLYNTSSIIHFLIYWGLNIIVDSGGTTCTQMILCPC